jgi:hypothetical protein
MDVLSGIFSAFGLSASAGLNAYIPLLVVALMARFTNLMQLEAPWDTLTNPWIIGVLVLLSGIEFFADKIPAVNHLNDAVQTVVRPTAGAIAFASSSSVVTDMNPILALALGLLVAGSVHTAKAGALRPAVTASTGGLGNAAVSTLEDIVAAVVSILAILIPIFVGIFLVMVVSWVIWWMWRRENRLQRQRAAKAVDK